MKPSDIVYQSHVLDAITQIEAYTAGLSYEQFSRTRLAQDGVIRQLEIIGEAKGRGRGFASIGGGRGARGDARKEGRKRG
ncbi:MAG: DUF86 domain-containing protein [Anaerolineae bacterium]|nr:DUF86 domain-containing protein [Anaerolineae bacterium]